VSLNAREGIHQIPENVATTSQNLMENERQSLPKYLCKPSYHLIGWLISVIVADGAKNGEIEIHFATNDQFNF
jgi:hypothetical protein